MGNQCNINTKGDQRVAPTKPHPDTNLFGVEPRRPTNIMQYTANNRTKINYWKCDIIIPFSTPDTVSALFVSQKV